MLRTIARFVLAGARRPALLLVLALLSLPLLSVPVVAALSSSSSSETTTSGDRVSFSHVVVDADNPRDPHNKAMGDIDGDGFVDLVVASANGGGIVWYEYPAWTKHQIATGSYTTDMQVGDVDGDGDLDMIIPDATGILWFENPGPGGDPRTAAWTRHLIGAEGANNHDVEVGDLNGDGKLDVVTRRKEGGGTYAWIQQTPTSWQKVTVTTRAGEGTALGDIDGDGDLDIAQNGFWLENPGSPITDQWIEHTIATNWPLDVGVHIADVSGNGRADVILSPSESPGRLSWYEAADPKNGPWTEHLIENDVAYIHTFKTGDVDGDGKLDIVTAEMHQAPDPDEVAVYFNEGGGASWSKQVLSGAGSHNIRIGDVDADGDIDIFGANWNDGAPNSAVVELWRNERSGKLPLDRWRRHVVDPSKPWGSIFVAAEDLDGDGRLDIATGGWWYKQSADGSWARNEFGSPLKNLAVVADFDGDGRPDVLGTQGEGSSSNANFAWARNEGGGAFTVLQNVPSGMGTFLQGAVAARFAPGGPKQVALSWHEAGQGVQMLTVPSSPSETQWTWSRISSISQDEALSAGDIDGDGDLDLLLGTKWLENVGGTWREHTLHASAEEPDRNVLADMDGDGRLDAVVSFEVSDPPGKVAWYRQPADPTAPWEEQVVGHIVMPLSLGVADVDGDGDLDVVAGEHDLANPSSSRLIVFENLGGGTSWEPHVVHTGDEHHDGALPVDIDGDGDIDIVSIGWSHGRVLLYENLAIDGGGDEGDQTPPRIDAAVALDAQTVKVTFSEALERASAEALSSYAIDGGITVVSASLDQTGKIVTLTTSPLAQGVTYKLSVSDVRDLAGNVIASPATATVSLLPIPAGDLGLWLRADAGITTVDGAAVSQWADQSGNGRNAVQSLSLARPSIVANAVNGQPAVRFDGQDDHLTFGMPVNGLSGVTLVLVSANTADRTGAPSGAGSAPLFWNETAWWGTLHLSPFQSRVTYRFGTTKSDNLPSYTRPSSIGSQYSITVATKNGANEALYVNGTRVLQTSGNGTTLQGIRDVGNLGRGYDDNTYFPGEIAEVIVYTRALTDSERASLDQYLQSRYMGGSVPDDTTPPSVSVTQPAAGATVSGLVTVAAEATDDVGVAGVQFRVNGTNIGTEATSAPYTATWNTTQLPNGSHRLSAVARDGAGSQTTSAEVTVEVANSTTPGIRSDAFDGAALDTSVWRVFDPVGDSSVSVASGQLRISVPAGVQHDLWEGALRAPRVLQAAPDADFEVEAKFDSAVSETHQLQGLVAQAGIGDLVRFDVYSTAGVTRVFGATFVNGSANVRVNQSISSGAPVYLRMQRAGSTWTLRYSHDGTSWTTAASFAFSLAVNEVGLFAGNAGSSPPAFTALVDYFGVVGVAPSPPPPDTTPPVISGVAASPATTAATVTWSTDEPADSVVEYGPTTAYGETRSLPELVTSHSVSLVELTCGTTYHFRVSSADAAGNRATSAGATFTTGACDPPPDTTPPVISGVAASPATTAASVTWSTDEPADSVVDYGPTTAYGETRSLAELVTAHSVSLVELTCGTTYHFRVSSADAGGNRATSADATFTTEACPPPPDTTPPVISAVGVNAGATSAVVSWSTDEPADSRMEYGATSALGETLSDPNLVTSHSLSLSGLVCETTYHYRVSSADAAGNSATTPTATFVTAACPEPGSLRSDEFDGGSLDSSLWRVFDPLGDSGVSVASGQLRISVPEGVRHDLWEGALEAPRILQAAPNADFEVEARFDSAVTLTHQLQGLVAQADTSNFVRFDVHSAYGATRVFAATFVNGSANVRVHSSIAVTAPFFLRMKRAGSTWTLSYSGDGSSWTTAASFGFSLALNEVGLFAGNVGSPPPAFTSRIEYFRVLGTGEPPPPPPPDTTAPVISGVAVNAGATAAGVTWLTDEPADSVVEYGPTTAYGETRSDSNLVTSHGVNLSGLVCETTYHYRVSSADAAGNRATSADATFTTGTCGPLAGPDIAIWYGDVQRFGQPGFPQRWLNVLGRATHPEGVAWLEYQVGSGQRTPLAYWGNERLAQYGDFNIELDRLALAPGRHVVTIFAADNAGNVTSRQVEVDVEPATTWPLPFATDWSTGITGAAQIVDGRWGAVSGGVRTLIPGYDRLLAIGDETWTGVDATVQVTIHSLDLASPHSGVGLAVGWRGHEGDARPRTEWPLGALCFYFRNQPDPHQLWLMQSVWPIFVQTDGIPNRLLLGVPYVFRFRAHPTGTGDSEYSCKVWPAGSPEPAAWDVSAVLPTRAGSVLLVADYADVTFGPVGIRASGT